MQIDKIRALVNTEMEAVVTTIAEQFGSDVQMIKDVSKHIASGGGKRLRPMIALLSAKAFNYSGQHHILVAAIVELIHTATLLHDDVVDHSKLRRGKKTANEVFGNEASVLVGDFLYSRAFQMMIQIQSMQVMRILADASNIIAEGEVMQLVNCNQPNTKEKQYLTTIFKKTAKLFEAAAQLGAVVAEQPEAVQNNMATYGRELGTAFQLVDDALDYGSSNKDIGKSIGDDLAEGKPTLPLIYVLNNGSANQKTLVKQAIENNDISNLEAIKTAIQDTGALEYTLRQAHKHAEQAIIALDTLAESQAKHALITLAEYAVKRSY